MKSQLGMVQVRDGRDPNTTREFEVCEVPEAVPEDWRI